MNSSLTGLDLDILNRLIEVGGWVKPSEVGAASGSHHYVVLRRLVRGGHVERRSLPSAGTKGSYEYRARRRLPKAASEQERAWPAREVSRSA
jgi:hypothetical protein